MGKGEPNVTQMLLDEFRLHRKEVKDWMEKMDGRVGTLEDDKNKLLGGWKGIALSWTVVVAIAGGILSIVEFVPSIAARGLAMAAVLIAKAH